MEGEFVVTPFGLHSGPSTLLRAERYRCLVRDLRGLSLKPGLPRSKSNAKRKADAKRLCAVLGSIEEEVAFAGVAGEGGGAGELGAGFVGAVEFDEEVASDAGKQVVVLQGGFVR
jgi:hypothetical protein